MPQFTNTNMTPAARAISVRWQSNAWALRQEMGYPLTPMTNESVKWTAGVVADWERSMEVARIAAALSRDLIYCGYRTVKASQPVQVALAYRDEDVVDWRPSLELWAADHDAPVILVDRERGERYEKGERNTLVRRAGLPVGDLTRGRRIAEARVRRTAAVMPKELGADGYLLPHGADVAQHMPPLADLAVRFA